MKRYKTRGGILVEERGREVTWDDKRKREVVKILAFRVSTGGFHGKLHLAKLKPVKERRS